MTNARDRGRQAISSGRSAGRAGVVVAIAMPGTLCRTAGRKCAYRKREPRGGGASAFTLSMVHAAAANTSPLATTTGIAPIIAPYTIHSAAPDICAARNNAGRLKKYD